MQRSRDVWRQQMVAYDAGQVFATKFETFDSCFDASSHISEGPHCICRQVTNEVLNWYQFNTQQLG